MSRCSFFFLIFFLFFFLYSFPLFLIFFSFIPYTLFLYFYTFFPALDHHPSFTDYYHYNYCCHISLNLANVYDHAYNNNLGIEVYGLKTNNVDYNLDNR